MLGKSLLQTLVTLVCVAVSRRLVQCRVVSPQLSKVWGPGLETQINSPARFLYIQAYDVDGDVYKESAGENIFTITITRSSNDQRIRAGVMVFDRHDGTYIARYRLHESVEDVKVSVLFHQVKHVADSPYILNGMVYHEFCRCPVSDINKWLKGYNCPDPKQIHADLSPFKNGVNISEVAPFIMERYAAHPGAHSLCHYKIIDNKIYLKTFGEHVGFKMFSNEMLLSITRKVKLPDMEFFLNLGDWPLVKKSMDKVIPILSWCGSTDTLDIVMPTYDIMESTFHMMTSIHSQDTKRVSLDMMSVQGNSPIAWKDRIQKGFFRGRDSRQERLDLVEMSREHPDLIDAALTNMFFFPENETKYGKIVKHISFFDFFKYKYQINLDGTVAAYRFPYLMGGNSVILKQDSHFYEHFYNDLEAWKHYIPVKHNLSDLMEKLQWAIENDDKSEEIAKNARQFANDHLMPDKLLCYYVSLFQEYSQILLSKPIKDESFELVEDPKDDTYNNYACHCVSDTVTQPRDEL